jgi:hypothetical protein
MKNLAMVLLGMVVSGLLSGACGPAREEVVVPAEAAVGPEALKIRAGYSITADVLRLVEGVSLWRRGMDRTYHKSFEQYFGLDGTDRQLLRKFAFARSELEEKFQKEKTRPSFEKPFGPEGLFPSGQASLVERFWTAVMRADHPASVARSMAGIMEPADAEAVAAALVRLAPRAGELIQQHGGYQKEVAALRGMMEHEQIQKLIEALGRFAGVDTAGIEFLVHPVWAPEGSAFEAVAYGDRILVNLPEGKPISPVHGALVIHEIGRRLLARMPADKKAFLTLRFIETAGNQRTPFALVEGVLDAFSHGLAAPIFCQGPGQIPPWPGDDRRKRLAEALTPLMRDYLSKGKPIDGVFVNQAAKLEFGLNPPTPKDFLDGAMVIAEDFVIKPFKSQVTRWTVWKFPPSAGYNYVRKLSDNPGRTVLLLCTQRDVDSLLSRFKGLPKLTKAVKQAARYLDRKEPVMIAMPRIYRGFYFVLGAASPGDMKSLAKAFYALKEIPKDPVILE